MIARRCAQFVAKLYLKLGLPGDAVALLDYDRHAVKLAVSSPMEYHTRLHACKKEPETVEWIEHSLTSGDVLYDVGANVGTYTLVASAYWGEAVRIVAIEPSAINFARLVHNLMLNGCHEHVIALPIALAKTTGMSTFHYQNFTPGGSLHALTEARDYRGNTFVPAASCPMLAFDLDTVVRQFGLPLPTHVKLDVDGTELAILEGAERTLRGVRSILVELDEAHPQSRQVRAFLGERGFKEEGAYPYRYGDAHPEFRGISNVIFGRPDAGRIA